MTHQRRHQGRTVAIIIAAALFATACQTATGGKSAEAPIVDQVALLKKKQAEAEQQVADIMAAAQAMAAKGDLRGAIFKYQTALKPAAFSEVPKLKGSVLNEITLLTGRLAAPPAVPDSARRSGIRGETLLQGAKTVAAFQRAALEFSSAIDAAPWWSSVYYNLALAFEGAESADYAISAYKWFLNAEPNAKEAPTIRDRMVALEVVAEEQARKNAWNGYWRSGSGSLLRSELKNNVLTMVEVEVSDAAKKIGYYNGQVVFSGTLNGETVSGKTMMPHCFEGSHWACKRCFPGFRQVTATYVMTGPDGIKETYDDSFMDRFNTNNCAILATTRVKGNSKYTRDKAAQRARPGS